MFDRKAYDKEIYQKKKQYYKDKSKKWKKENPERSEELIQNWRKENLTKYIVYKGKRIFLQYSPRTGVCSECGAVKGINCKRTSIHHEVYDDNDPIAHTVELCNGCHNKERTREKEKTREIKKKEEKLDLIINEMERLGVKKYVIPGYAIEKAGSTT